METGYKVCDAMTEQPVTISPDATLQQCALLMSKEHVGALLVKEGEKIVGILTERDIVRKAVAKNVSPSSKKARDIMETALKTISPEKDILEALKIMRDYNIRHLPVIDRGKFLGVITLKDILKIHPELFEIMVEKIEIREAERKLAIKGKVREGICQNCGKYSDDLRYVEGQMMCPDCREEW
ncbi:MAG: CBS domain-containing protein [Candidatus Woesearchaeota archaeon]